MIQKEIRLVTVSIVIAARNEEGFISQCLDSILANDYPKSLLEVLVVDGMSDDRTRAIVEDYHRRYGFVKLVDNPKRVAPSAFNIGVRRGSGEVVMIMGAHAVYCPHYISGSVMALERYGAANVGGIIKAMPRDGGLFARSLVLTLSHRFGVGNSHFRCATGAPKWVDTVFGGCYRREVFAKVGLFNEELVHNQDLEFNLRLRRAGGKILLVPDIVSYYYARSDPRSFCKHSFRDGCWVISSFLYSDGIALSWRHLAPLCFVTAIVTLAVLSLLARPFFWALVGVLVSYGAANISASVMVARRERDLRCIGTMPIAFSILHLTYGAGSLSTLARMTGMKAFWRQICRLAMRRNCAVACDS